MGWPSLSGYSISGGTTGGSWVLMAIDPEKNGAGQPRGGTPGEPTTASSIYHPAAVEERPPAGFGPAGKGSAGGERIGLAGICLRGLNGSPPASRIGQALRRPGAQTRHRASRGRFGRKLPHPYGPIGEVVEAARHVAPVTGGGTKAAQDEAEGAATNHVERAGAPPSPVLPRVVRRFRTGTENCTVNSGWRQEMFNP